MDPLVDPRPERVGDIFHAPDQGRSSRFRANPYGFAQWFLGQIAKPSPAFRQSVLDMRKAVRPADRISRGLTIVAKTDIDDLPDERHPLADAPQVLVLKLMKRYLNLRYAKRSIRRPPSVYLSKLAALVPPSAFGLCAQLEDYTEFLWRRVDLAVRAGGALDERNPVFPEESFTDRWPKGDIRALEVLRNDLTHLRRKLEEARGSDLRAIQTIFAELFGERTTEGSIRAYIEAVRRGTSLPRYEQGAGFVAAPALGLMPASAPTTSPAPRHHFHSAILKP